MRAVRKRMPPRRRQNTGRGSTQSKQRFDIYKKYKNQQARAPFIRTMHVPSGPTRLLGWVLVDLCLPTKKKRETLLINKNWGAPNAASQEKGGQVSVAVFVHAPEAFPLEVRPRALVARS